MCLCSVVVVVGKEEALRSVDFDMNEVNLYNDRGVFSKLDFEYTLLFAF